MDWFLYDNGLHHEKVKETSPDGIFLKVILTAANIIHSQFANMINENLANHKFSECKNYFIQFRTCIKYVFKDFSNIFI